MNIYFILFKFICCHIAAIAVRETITVKRNQIETDSKFKIQKKKKKKKKNC